MEANTRSDPGPDARLESEPPPVPWWIVSAQLAAFAFHLPLLQLTGTGVALARGPTAILVGAAVFAVGLLIFLVVARFTTSKWTSLAIVSVLMVFFWHWSEDESAAMATPSTLRTILLLAVALTAAARFGTHRYFRVGALTGALIFSGTLALTIAVDAIGTPPSSLKVPTAISDFAPTETPDIVLLVVDAYARADILEHDYSFDNGPFLDRLRDAGFSVPSRASANYNGTHLSVPSLLSLDYLVYSGASIHNSDLNTSATLTGGDNRLVHTLGGAGYTYVHGGTTYWNNSCGPEVDVCLPSPTLDATAWALLDRTPVSQLLFGRTGHPFTAMNLLRISLLRNWPEHRESWPDGPVFAFIHMLLPHPPMYLDSECTVRIAPELGGHILRFHSMTEPVLERRKSAYVEQVECANRTIEAFVEQVDRDAVVVITADHGPDARGPLLNGPSEWEDIQLRERYSTFTAIRLPANCPEHIPDDHELVNTFRRVLNCLDPSLDLPMLEPRYFAAHFAGVVLEIEDPDLGFSQRP